MSRGHDRSPSELIALNSTLEGNTRRAIDFPESAEIDEAAFRRSRVPRWRATRRRGGSGARYGRSMGAGGGADGRR